MKYTVPEVLKFIKENDVKFIKLAFCDIFGTQKNLSILPDELPRAFTEGLSFDASSIRGFSSIDRSDFLLFPDPTTLTVLPWRPTRGRVVRFYCNIRLPDGTPFDGDSRLILRQAIDRAEKMGFTFQIGAECEFYLFRLDENGNATKQPYDQASYMDVGPLDKGENVRREICLTLEEMGFYPETSHHEQGPGQNEIDFRYDETMEAADSLISFKSTVKAIAARNGLFASFMPKPLRDKSGNGLHINLSAHHAGKNIFRNDLPECKAEAMSFIAGILRRAVEMTVFLNPLTNSYARLGLLGAPSHASWSPQNRSQLIRVPAAKGDYSRIEVRSPDPACNPYIAYALLIHAGLDGIRDKLPPVQAVNADLYQADPSVLAGIPSLPNNLLHAVEMAQQSDFISGVLPASLLSRFYAAKRSEYESLLKADHSVEYEDSLYFSWL